MVEFVAAGRGLPGRGPVRRIDPPPCRTGIQRDGMGRCSLGPGGPALACSSDRARVERLDETLGDQWLESQAGVVPEGLSAIGAQDRRPSS